MDVTLGISFTDRQQIKLFVNMKLDQLQIRACSQITCGCRARGRPRKVRTDVRAILNKYGDN